MFSIAGSLFVFADIVFHPLINFRFPEPPYPPSFHGRNAALLGHLVESMCSETEVAGYFHQSHQGMLNSLGHFINSMN